MKILALTTALLVAVVMGAPKATLTGSLCVAPAPRETRPETPPGNAQVVIKHQFSVQVDSLPPAVTNESSSVLIANLDPTTKHLVRIRDNGKVVESFWFSFEKQGAKDLCLWFGHGYETWSLWPAKEARAFCK
jgi:hypothetical protein